jgi:hypothetical protein
LGQSPRFLRRIVVERPYMRAARNTYWNRERGRPTEELCTPEKNSGEWITQLGGAAYRTRERAAS